jgi:ankyrin repeat protein
MRPVALLVGLATSLAAAGACMPRPPTPLAAAAAANDVPEVRRLMAAGLPDDDAHDALNAAARGGALDTLTLLLDAGVEADRRDTHANDWTPLQHAIHKQESGAARVLLEYGADPNGSSAPGSPTPLLMAADDPDPTIVKLLLAYGANPRTARAHGDTPLGRAVSGGALSDIDRPLFGGCRPATVRALVTHDRALRVPHDPAGMQAIWWARFHGCKEVLELIGERPTKPGQTIVGAVGLLHDHFRRRPQDAQAPTPATDAPSPR